MEAYLNSPKPLIVSVSIHSAITIIIIPLGIHLLYQLLCSPHRCDSKVPIEPSVKVLCCIFALLFVPQTICNLMVEICSISDYTSDTPQRSRWNLAMNIFYALVNVCLYLIVIQRYYLTFSDSAYSSRPALFVLISSLVLLYSFMYCCYVIVYSSEARFFADEHQANKFYIAENLTLLLVDALFSVVMIYLFCLKLQRLILDSYRRSSTAQFANTRQDELGELTVKNVRLSESQQKLIYVATKLVVITLPALLSTTVLWSVSTCAWFVEDTHPNSRMLPLLIHGLHALFVPINIVCNFCCIYLHFEFNKKVYSILCYSLDKCCLKCCIYITGLRIVEQTRKQLGDACEEGETATLSI